MALSARRQTVEAVKRLSRYIKSGDRSIREIATMTMGLDPPERLHHTHIAVYLKARPGSNLFLQQCLLLLNIINYPDIALLFDFDSADDARKVEKHVKTLLSLTQEQRAQVFALAETLSARPKSRAAERGSEQK